MSLKRIVALFLILVLCCSGCAAVVGGSVSASLNTLPPLHTTGLSDQHPAQTLNPSAEITAPLEVHYIDVGQADAALLICDGQTMLIDGGNVADSDLIVAYLRKLGIDYLDIVIGTHSHEDHIGGLAGALSVYKAGTIYIPKTTTDSKAYQNFIRKAESASESIVTPQAGDEVQLGESSIVFLGPITENPDNLNNTSICLKIIHGKTSFLFTGDAEMDAEKSLVDAGYDLSATVLKAPHHGSDSSSNYIFLREVMPQYVVISVGKDNTYGHPDDNTLSRYRDADVQVYRTDLQGDVVCISDGNTVSFSTEKNAGIITNPTIPQ